MLHKEWCVRVKEREGSEMESGLLEAIQAPSGELEFRVKALDTLYEIDRHTLHSSLLAKQVRITLDAFKATKGDAEQSGFFYERDICTVTIEREVVDKLLSEILPILDVGRKQRSTIASTAFYQKHKVGGVDVKSLDEAIFPTQMQAFLYFDSFTTEERRKLKIFCVQMKSDGQRKYAVIHWERFLSEYLASRREDRHVFEMIRDSFPCRLFFDLEFSIKCNPGVEGNDLTAKWIHLVAWKVQLLWGITLGREHFVVYDSTQPGVKFSKHITVIIPSPTRGLALDMADTGASEIGKEMLFLNYSHVNAFVQALVTDVTSYVEEEVAPLSSVGEFVSSEQFDSSLPPPTLKRTVAVPRLGFEELWVNTEKGDRPTLFVDTGVYTRNRVFRMFGSSKHTPKNAPDKPILTLCRFGKLWYPFKEAKIEPNEKKAGRLSVERDEPNSPRPLVNHRDSHKALYRERMEAGCVVPHDLFDDAPLDPRKVMVFVPSDRSVRAVESRKRPAGDRQGGLGSPKATKADSPASKENLPPPRGSSMASEGGGSNLVDLSSEAPMTSPISVPLDSLEEAGEEQRVIACDALTFNPRYWCLRFIAGKACMGEMPQNWACRQASAASQGEDKEECQREQGGNTCGFSELQQPYLCIESPTPLHVRCDDPIAAKDSFPLSSSSSSSHSAITAQYLGNTADMRFHNENVLRMGYGEPSPFPRMDHFVLRVYVPDALKKHPNERDSTPVRITHWKVYGVTKNKGREGAEVVIKIQYSLTGGYRFCHKIGRHHKSNGVKLEVNLSDAHATRALQQTCWDPDCRNFKSFPGDPVPYVYYSPKSELDEYIQEYLEKNTDFEALETAV